MMAKLSLSERLNLYNFILLVLIGIPIAILGVIATLFAPELRCKFGYKSDACPKAVTKYSDYYFLWIQTYDSENYLYKNRLKLFRQGQEVYSKEDEGRGYINVHFSEQILEGSSSQMIDGIVKGKDITGDGILDVVLEENCACSAGIKYYSIISMGDKVESVFEESTIANWSFEDIDKDGIYELITEDLSFGRDYGWVPARERYSPPVILKFKDGKFRFATNLMKENPPLKSAFISNLEKAKAESEDGKKLTAEAKQYMVQLAYSGNGNSAREFLNLVLTKASDNEKNFFWNYEFIGDIASSNYWEDLKIMNKWNTEEYINLADPY